MATVALDEKYENLTQLIGGMGRTLIAFSGGVDSTFLARVAHGVLGRDAVAVTALSPTYPATELEEAKELAAAIGIEHRLIETHELEKEEYAVNNPDRCFHCKKELFTEMQVIAAEEGFETIVYGGIMDDLGDHRPGMEAAELLNARAPLVEVELQKHEIRQLSKGLGLSTWDKPGGACLASRIPYGMRVTLEKLHQVDQAEHFLHKLGFRLVRVRHHGDIARIEAPPEDLPRLFEDDAHTRIVAELKEIGVKYVALDMQGYRTGSLNETLADHTIVPLQTV
ncbi:MAG: ATP-dependent sacrificial sulfur transferase LarE [Chloroflexi bacterium]|nr:ATP-dependent sacrificial sulfur transferase LarE [Chloroflexota bacterium]